METSFTCSKCHDNFSTKDDYRKHILRPHKVKSTRVQFPIKKVKQDSSAKETKNLSKRSSRASSKLPKNYNKVDEHPTSSKKDQRNSKNVSNRRLRNSKNDPNEFQRRSKLEVKTQEKNPSAYSWKYQGGQRFMLEKSYIWRLNCIVIFSCFVFRG